MFFFFVGRRGTTVANISVAVPPLPRGWPHLRHGFCLLRPCFEAFYVACMRGGRSEKYLP